MALYRNIPDTGDAGRSVVCPVGKISDPVPTICSDCVRPPRGGDNVVSINRIVSILPRSWLKFIS